MVFNFLQVKLPLEIGIKIPENDPVRLLSKICDELDYTVLYKQYQKHWRKYNPVLLFKVLLYGYLNGKFSSREIEEACKRDICFMWLLDGYRAPDHATIARFQNERLVPVIKDLFYQFVSYLDKQDEIHGRNIFIDGTKIEAYASKYSFVWKKCINKHIERLSEKISDVLSKIICRYGLKHDLDLYSVLNTLKQQAVFENLVFVNGKGKRKKQLQRDIEKLEEYLLKHTEYSDYLTKMGNRPSLSKVDTDATFMHMKEDHMRNGQLKPGYNIQIGVDSEYIVNIGSFPDRNDTNTLIPFLSDFCKATGKKYANVIADASYESEENYAFLERNGQNAYIKPQNYEVSKTKKFCDDVSKYENMHYNETDDFFVCKNGKTLKYISTSKSTTINGYKVQKRNYRCENCSGCIYREKCFKSQRYENRQISVSIKMLRYRRHCLQNIASDVGIKLRINRSIQVEGAFGVIKENYAFRRFLTRGKRKTETQFFLIAFAFNVLKFHNKSIKGRLKTELFDVQAC